MRHTATAVYRRLRFALIAAGTLLACGGAAAQVYTFPRPPKIVPPPPDQLVQISAGAHHTCAVRHDGGLLCWGNNESGQSGIGPNSDCGFACTKVPTRVNSTWGALPYTAMPMPAVRKVSGGEHHTCALDRTGKAWCWGYNLESQTGTAAGGYGYFQVWQPLPVNTATTFSDISAGIGLTCGVEPMATWCWGSVGRLAGTTRGTAAPEAIPRSGNHQAVTTGREHVCMQTNVSGWNDVNCLGRNAFGQMSWTPAEFSMLVDGGQPVVIGTNFGRPVGAPATRNEFTCVDRPSEGTVVCAGANTLGYLGDGTLVPSVRPVTVGGAGFRLSGVTVGWWHACAIDPLQQAWCWGDGAGGKLGNGSTARSSRPVLVGGGTIKFRALAAGQHHTCGIGTDNQIYCWGLNDRAQFGAGYVGGWHWLPQPAAPARL